MIAENISEKISAQQPQLNEDQQMVLAWLKGRSKSGNSPFAVVQGFRGLNGITNLEMNAFMRLSNKEESQVLQAYCKWVLEKEAE